MRSVLAFSILIIISYASCTGIKTIPETYAEKQERKRPVLVVYMDGTSNRPHGLDELNKNTYTYTLFTLRDTNVRNLYVEGVGANRRIGQGIFAWTTNERTMRAYRFLAENYEKGDSILLFGFSRGANQCRILSGIIYCIGILDLNSINTSDRQPLLEKLYETYIKASDVNDKREKLSALLARHHLKPDTTGSTRIQLMGLWDTVEAFEVVNGAETIIPVQRHLNQLYNVDKVFHAVSLDDNRSKVYTPILLTHKDVALQSEQQRASLVEEVWFNGSHRDVGGGVNKKKKDKLSGISLRWMMERIRPYGINKDSVFTTDIYGKVNRTSAPLRWFMGGKLRSIDDYREAMHPDWNGTIKIHSSVKQRLDSGIVQAFKLKKKGGDWYDWEPFKDCFDRDAANDSIRRLRPDCNCIEVVYDRL